MGWFDDFTDSIKSGLKGEINSLMKADGLTGFVPDGDNVPQDQMQISQNKGSVGQKAIIDDPYFDQIGQNYIFKTKLSRISNKTLKDTSLKTG